MSTGFGGFRHTGSTRVWFRVPSLAWITLTSLQQAVFAVQFFISCLQQPDNKPPQKSRVLCKKDEKIYASFAALLRKFEISAIITPLQAELKKSCVQLLEKMKNKEQTIQYIMIFGKSSIYAN